MKIIKGVLITLLLTFTATLFAVAPGEPKWAHALRMPPAGDPVVGPNNAVYISTADNLSTGFLWSFDTNRGAKNWAYAVHNAHITPPAVNMGAGDVAVVVGSNPYTLNVAGQIYGITASGQTKWQIKLDNLVIPDPFTPGVDYRGIGWAGEPAIQASSGIVYVPILVSCTNCAEYGSTVSVVGAFNLNDGRLLKWMTPPAFQPGDPTFPAYELVKASYCNTTSGYVACNKLIVHTPTKNYTESYVFDSTSIFMAQNAGVFSLLQGSPDKNVWAHGDDRGYLWSLRTDGHGYKWKVLLDGANLSYANVMYGANNLIYVGSFHPPIMQTQNVSDFLFLVNPDGTRKATFPLPIGGTGYAVAVGTDGTIYINLENGFLEALDGNTGITKWRIDLDGETAPVIDSRNNVYICSHNGVLYAF